MISFVLFLLGMLLACLFITTRLGNVFLYKKPVQQITLLALAVISAVSYSRDLWSTSLLLGLYVSLVFLSCNIDQNKIAQTKKP